VLIETIRRRAALMAVLGFVFHLDVQDPTRLKSAFELASALAQTTPIRALRFPRRHDRLAEVVGTVIHDCD
jgi:hypothetical protein